MKNNSILRLLAMCVAFSLCAFACNAPATDTAAKAVAVSEKVEVKPDLVKIKAEIQALNNTWAAASTAKDIATIMAFYADDAVSMPSNKPIVVGKAAIEKDIVADFEKRKANLTVTYETTEVFGNNEMITELGKGITKDATGKIIYTGKYMELWAKRNGKWQVIREIYNDDAKEK